MRTVDIKPDMKQIKQIISLYEAAFPPNERYTPEEIFTLSEQCDNVKYTAFYDGDDLLGTMLFAAGDSVLYLFYIVIAENHRSHGLGTQLISWLKQNYPGRIIAVDIEPRDNSADNALQRERRFRFYEKNGFTDTGWRETVDGGEYAVLCSRPETPDVICELKELILHLDEIMCSQPETPILFIKLKGSS